MFNADKVRGYSKLNDIDKKLFRWFCGKFYKAWEHPEDHQPIGIEKMNAKYLKVTLSDSSWLHILEDGSWY